MDPKKLARLRELGERPEYGGRDPRVKAFLDALGEEFPEPYAGISTLLDAPHREKLEGLDVALVGVPFDLGVTNRPGARFGPRAIRQVSNVGPYHHHLKTIPFMLASIGDVGDVPINRRFGLDAGIERIEQYFHRVVDAGTAPLSAGGDHSISYPILKAVGRREPVGLVHIDAHCDTGGALENSKFHHGGPFRNAALAGVLDPERTIQIGIRGFAEMIWDFSYDSGMTVVHIEDFHEMGLAAVIEKVRDVVGAGPTYVSLDVDGIDPAFTPGTGTPEVGGLTPREAQAILRGLRGLHLVGGDVVEVAPEYDATDNTARVGATMMFEILCVLAESVSSRR
jgi:agmatinase